MDVQLCVTNPLGSIYHIKVVVRDCLVIIHDRIFLTDLVLLEIQRYDVILGIDWLAKHNTTISCEKMLLTLTTLEGEKMKYRGSNLQKTASVILTT